LRAEGLRQKLGDGDHMRATRLSCWDEADARGAQAYFGNVLGASWLEPNFRLTLYNVEITYRTGCILDFSFERGFFMNLIKRAGAWCNGEVAYIAWDVEKEIKGCVGFMVTRVHETGEDAGQRRILPTWIAFTDQNNPNWNAQ